MDEINHITYEVEGHQEIILDEPQSDVILIIILGYFHNTSRRKNVLLSFAGMPCAEARGVMAIGDRAVARRAKAGWLRRSFD